MAGRPKVRSDLAKLTTLTVEDADSIFNRIGDGELLYRIAASFNVGRTALSEWIEASPERKDRYKRACERKADAVVDETFEIADGANRADGEAPPESDVGRDKLRIQVRQWAAARWNREAYGEQTKVTGQMNLAVLHIDALRRAGPVAPDVKVIEGKLEGGLE